GCEVDGDARHLVDAPGRVVAVASVEPREAESADADFRDAQSFPSLLPGLLCDLRELALGAVQLARDLRHGLVLQVRHDVSGLHVGNVAVRTMPSSASFCQSENDNIVDW